MSNIAPDRLHTGSGLRVVYLHQ